MRKFLIVLFLLLAVSHARSQVIISLLLGDKLNTGKIEFGLEGGYNNSTISGLEGAKGMGAFNLGFYFDFVMKNPRWKFNTGVIVKSSMGAGGLPVYSTGNDAIDSSFSGGKVERNIRYFNVPVMMKYTFKSNIFVKAGFQLGLRNKAFDEFFKTVNDKDDLKYKINTKDNYHPLDAGLAVGLGYRLMGGNGMNLGIQYYYGLIDFVVSDTSPNQFNRVFYATVGIPIGKGKKKEKEKEQVK
jgi:hypothetical protein